MNVILDDIKEIITPALNDIGLWVVSVRLMGGVDNQNLQIMIDRNDDTVVDVNDCENASHTISAILDVEDPIKTAYNLEISTPGIDRPLVRSKDWQQFIGFEVKVELKNSTDTGRRRYRGIIKGFAKDLITLTVDNSDEVIDINNVLFAKLILTDELIKFSQQQAINS